MSIIKKELISLAEGLCNYAICGEGNVSGIENDVFYIKSSGCELKNLQENDLISCDLFGKQLNFFNKKPSLEVGFHLYFLQNKNIKFVAHTHPIKTMQILCGNKIFEFAENRFFPDQVVRNGKKSCVIPYATPGKKLFQSIEFYIKKFCDSEGYFPKLILLQNHGIICPGSSTKECIASTKMCEKSAEIFVGCHELGSINYLTLSEIDEIETCPIEQYRKELLK
jgi:L-fuculose-phosphate aldolase